MRFFGHVQRGKLGISQLGFKNTPRTNLLLCNDSSYDRIMSSFDEFDAFEAAAKPKISQIAMAARPTPYLDGLNPAQKEAVKKLDGPVLMLAGAGTGKTRALTTRIVHLLNTGTARPNEILAVTFTNKAAREMKNRVANLIGQVEGMPWMGTFHSICVKLLRRHAELVGLKSNFTILDTDDQIRLLKQLIAASNIDEKRWPARHLAVGLRRRDPPRPRRFSSRRVFFFAEVATRIVGAAATRDQLLAVADDCLQGDAAARPSFERLVAALGNVN